MKEIMVPPYMALRRMAVSRADFEREIMHEECPETSWLDEPENRERREAYERGEFDFVGVRAKIILKIPLKDKSAVSHTVKSPGIWGVESDSSEKFLNGLFKSEADTLIDMLQTMGIGILDVPENGRDTRRRKK